MASFNYTAMTCDLCQKKIHVVISKDYRDKTMWKEVVDNKMHEIEPWKRMTLPVVFTTEQNEGTACAPYFDNETVDICPECFDKLLKQWPITATGAQGYNTYRMK